MERFGLVYARVALGAAFLSAVASRFGLWRGEPAREAFAGFTRYTAEVNAFMPPASIPFLAWAATTAELSLGLALVVGFQTRRVALASSGLLALFGTAMAVSFGIKSPMDYSVFSASAAALPPGRFSGARGKAIAERRRLERRTIVKARINYGTASPGVYESMDALDRHLQSCGLERTLVFLVQLRVSQINGCAYCLDMHWKDLRAAGQTEQRLYSLDAWRECPYYTDRERAALAWAEAVTLVTASHVSDAVYADVRPHFNDRELSDLTLAVAAINAWNRLSIAARLVPGNYQPATSAV